MVKSRRQKFVPLGGTRNPRSGHRSYWLSSISSGARVSLGTQRWSTLAVRATCVSKVSYVPENVIYELL